MLYEEDQRMGLLKTHYLQLLDELRRLQKRLEERKAFPGVGGAPRIKRLVYCLRHPRPGFTGVFGGIDFSDGRGSTSSILDRDWMVYELGCVDISDEAERTPKPAESASQNSALAGRES